MDSIDVSFPPQNYQHPQHNRHQLLQKYTHALRQLRNLAEKSHNVRPFYFDNYLLLQYFQQQSAVENSDSSGESSPLAFLKLELLLHIVDRRRQILYWIFYLSLAYLCVFAYRHQESSSSSNSAESDQDLQAFVYPMGMRMWRRITLPLIQRFPRLTELYDESCLMQNPFFQVEDLSCEPCANVQNVLELRPGKEEDVSTQEGHGWSKSDGVDEDNFDVKVRGTPNEFVPFVFKINQDPIEIDDFYNIYANNQEIFQRDAYRVQSTNRDVTNLEELFSQFNHSQRHVLGRLRRKEEEQTHNLWRCNRMLPARLLRKLFASPTMRLSRTGIALERFMAIDTAQGPAYTLPDAKCANVYVQQAQGSRYIFLRPTSECRHRCRTLSMRLPQSFVLSYNWLYWKPISAPDPASETLSITLIGSYC